jgi:hypothetical protein
MGYRLPPIWASAAYGLWRLGRRRFNGATSADGTGPRAQANRDEGAVTLWLTARRLRTTGEGARVTQAQGPIAEQLVAQLLHAAVTPHLLFEKVAWLARAAAKRGLSERAVDSGR